MANWFYKEFGEEVGPVPPSVIRERVADGTIVAATSVRREDGEWTTADQVPGLLSSGRAVGPTNEGDSTGGLIPYKNGPALTSYYIGIFSLVPCLFGAGVLLGVPAIVCGVMGLKKRKQNPVVKGTAHAWVGIVLGSLSSLVTVGVIVAVIVAAVNQK